ncbi:unnamed protein product [Cylicocyclus nassatus]|uniref:MULE transposase domain-containing protein n=1 Tax=Cylicocyclus nassatus TaxID=53992 RepID=A0AA36GSZ5_CYLNA|nr:unnamed protein product [Cylicocyclus nassatus]
MFTSTDRALLRAVVFACRGCKRERHHLTVKVVGNEILNDPCEGHVCTPVNTFQDRANRLMYKTCQKVRSDPLIASKSIPEIWEETLQQTMTGRRGSEELVAYFYKYGLESRRRTIERARAANIHSHVTWDYVPRAYAFLEDGSPFLQDINEIIQLYYSSTTIRMACEKGLHALVMDGMHKILPSNFGDVQLYTIHGVLMSEHEVPLVYAFTRNKTQQTYERIFSRVQRELQAAGATDPSRIILDFEISALKAAERCFPNTSVEGCLFHLSQCWNRKRNALGITKSLKGPHRSAFVKKWWRTIKGIPFLPERFLSRLPGLFRPSMPDTHPAFECCEAFLVYLYDTWLSEPLRRYWCKWRIGTLRTTNIAECYHSKFRRSLGQKHASFQNVLARIKQENVNAVAKLMTFDQFDIGRHVRRKYSLRKEKISRKMESFERQIQGVVTTSALIRYCRAMSRFVSEKAI